MSQHKQDARKPERPSARAVLKQALVGSTATPASGARTPRAKKVSATVNADKAVRRVSARAADAEPGKASIGTRPRARAKGPTRAQQLDAEQSELRRAAAPASVPGIAHDVRAMFAELEDGPDDDERQRRAADSIGRIAARLRNEAPLAGTDEDIPPAGALRFLSPDYYMRQWSRFGMRTRSDRVDDFGLDPTYEATVQPILDLLYERYFRVAVEGVEHLPEEGPALLVCNHSGALPWDGVILKTAIGHAHARRRPLRWLTDDFVFHSPFVGAWLNRVGAVRACPENAERLLERGELLAAFPEGVKGIGKTYRERHELQRFGRGGHIKLALRLQVPLIPVAIVGGEEATPLLYKVRAFSKVLGLPFIPITPLFPLLGPLGLAPLPSRWHIAIGEPMQELQGLSPRAAGDTVLVNDLNQRLRGRVQDLLKGALAERGPNAFF